MARHFSKNSRRAIASLDPPYRKLIGPVVVTGGLDTRSSFVTLEMFY